jgi:hypothetical protein
MTSVTSRDIATVFIINDFETVDNGHDVINVIHFRWGEVGIWIYFMLVDGRIRRTFYLEYSRKAIPNLQNALIVNFCNFGFR